MVAGGNGGESLETMKLCSANLYRICDFVAQNVAQIVPDGSFYFPTLPVGHRI